MKEGKWLIISAESLEVNIKCGQYTKTHSGKTPMDILSLGQGLSGCHGLLLLPPYYNRDSQFCMSDSFQNFINEVNTYTRWDPLNITFPGIDHIN